MKRTGLPAERYDEAYMLLQPSRPVLVTTLDEDGTTHVAPFSWVTPLSVKPALMGLALLAKPKKQHTLENVERQGELVINVPGLEQAQQLVLCSYEQQPGVKKFKAAGFSALPSKEVKPDRIKECAAHLEGRATSITPVGDHNLVVMEVVAVSYRPEQFTSNLLRKTEESTPCFHLGHYTTNTGQAHLFLNICGTRLVEVPFPKR